MQLENNLNTTITNAPHPHYKRVIIAIALFFVVALIIVFGYQYFLSKKAMIVLEQKKQEALQIELIQQSQDYFANLPPRTQEVADRDRKASIEFFKSLPTQ